MDGYDTHYLLLTNAAKEIRGMMVFNQDAGDSSRVNLYHLSSTDYSQYEEVLDLGLDFIWKTMHC